MNESLEHIECTELDEAETSYLKANINQVIEKCKGNRKEINRLTLESVSAITEGEDCERQLANKKGLHRFFGAITGSNKILQDKINNSRTVAQFASQVMLQRLIENNCLSLELITAVTNKLNASLQTVEGEINEVYRTLISCFKQNRSEIINLSGRMERLEQNIALLNWQSTIKYQMLNCVEYAELDEPGKIVCLARDFYDITKGNWTTEELLLLKTAMEDIGLSPEKGFSLFSLIKTINSSPVLMGKLFNGSDLNYISDAEYLVLFSGIRKMESLRASEKYLVVSTAELLEKHGVSEKQETIADTLTLNYLLFDDGIDATIEVSCFDLILELLLNLYQLDTYVAETSEYMAVDESDSEEISPRLEAMSIGTESSQAPQLEEMTISHALIIKREEVKEFKNKIIHFKAPISCEGNLSFENCVLLYGETDLPDEITLEHGKAEINISGCIIRCFRKDARKNDVRHFIDAHSCKVLISQCMFLNCYHIVRGYKVSIEHSIFRNCEAGDNIWGNNYLLCSGSDECSIKYSVFDSCSRIMDWRWCIEECRFDHCSNIADLSESIITACQFNHCDGYIIRSDNGTRISLCEFNDCQFKEPHETDKECDAHDTYAMLDFSRRGKSDSVNYIEKCIFSGIKAGYHFFIRGEAGLYSNKNETVRVHDCIFFHCQSSRASKQLVRNYDNYMTSKKYLTVSCGGCRGLDDVGPDTYQPSEQPIKDTASNGEPIGISIRLPAYQE